MWVMFYDYLCYNLVTILHCLISDIMSIKDVIKKQYEQIVNNAYKNVSSIHTPSEGWLRTTRKALGIPPKVIYERLGITKNEFFRTERAETENTLTLQKLRMAAKAMDCELHYAIVPRSTVKEVIENKAKRHAVKMLQSASMQMAMEDQVTSMEQIDLQVEKVMKQLIDEKPDWFWKESHDYK